MNFCINCGEENQANSKFCLKCGESLNEEQESPKLSEMSRSVSQNSAKQKMSKQKKYVLSVLGFVLLIGIITHLILTNIYDPVKKIQAMNTAYNEQDKEAFFDLFSFKEDIEADPENFYAIVKDYGWNNLREILSGEVENLNTNKTSDIIFNSNGDEFISIVNKPVFLGLYNKVEFLVIPIEVFAYSPFKEMNIQIGNKEIMSKEKDADIFIGKFIPGAYKWSYTYNGQYMELSNEGELEVTGDGENKEHLRLDLNMETVYLESDIEDAIVFIDGKSTGKKVSELSEIYPLQLDKKVKIHAQSKDENGQELQSSALLLNDTEIYLPFEHIQVQRQTQKKMDELSYQHEDAVKNLFLNFRLDYEDAIYYIDFDYIDDYFPEGSQIKQDYAKFVTDHSKIEEYNYDFLLNDITKFEIVSESKFILETFETFNFSSASDGNLHYERKKKYSISYKNDSYFIDEIVDIETKKERY